MTSVNLTWEEAKNRSQMLKVDHYDVALDLKHSDTHFLSTTTVRFSTQEAGSNFIDLRADKLHEVRLNGNPLPTQSYDPTYGIPLSGLQVADYTLEVTAEIPFSRTGEGLHRFVDPADNEVYLYTQFETADAKRVFACFDQPDLKATYSLHFKAPEEWTIITNAPVTREGDTSHSEIDYPLSTYLVDLCAGPYHEVTDTWRGELTEHPEGKPAQKLEVPLGIYCRASLADSLDAERLFTETKQGFDFYHRNFGFPYPFGKYDQIFVPEFNAGAMENAGCVTIRDEYVFTSQATHYKYERRADTILHELAHMWFGDLVTMQWWDDLWLNESFATFASVLCQAEATEYASAWTTFANVEKSWAYRQDQLPSTHPVAADIPDIAAVEVNFDGITYAKGASVLKQLVAYVGLEDFLAGLRSYFAAHQFGNATFADLLGALEKSSGRDLSDWGDQWLRTTGINVIRPDFEVDDSGAFTRFAIIQDGAAPGAGETRVHRMRVGIYDDNASGALERVQSVELDVEGSVPQVATELREALPRPEVDVTVAARDGDHANATVSTTPTSATAAMATPHTRVWVPAYRSTQVPLRDTTANTIANGKSVAPVPTAEMPSPAPRARGTT